MTRGGPGGSSDIINTYIFKTATTNMRYGYSSAVGMIFMLVILLLTVFLETLL